MRIKQPVNIRAGAMAIAALTAVIMHSAPAVASVATTLSFFSDNDLRQGQVGATGTAFDAELGEPVLAGVRACCFSVTAAPVVGPPFELRRTFSSLNTVSQIYFMGVSTVADQNHLVIALNETFSTALVGQEFGSAFAGYSEIGLIADLFAQFDPSLTIEQRIAAGDRLGAFQDEVFAMNAGFGVTDKFALTSFSVGTPAGTGFSSLRLPAGAVPEPATWAMMMLGFGAVGSALRSRRKALTAMVSFS